VNYRYRIHLKDSMTQVPKRRLVQTLGAKLCLGLSAGHLLSMAEKTRYMRGLIVRFACRMSATAHDESRRKGSPSSIGRFVLVVHGVETGIQEQRIQPEVLISVILALGVHTGDTKTYEKGALLIIFAPYLNHHILQPGSYIRIKRGPF
jgi:hypothetical protein